jgi:hypothetical protein
MQRVPGERKRLGLHEFYKAVLLALLQNVKLNRSRSLARGRGIIDADYLAYGETALPMGKAHKALPLIRESIPPPSHSDLW